MADIYSFLLSLSPIRNVKRQVGGRRRESGCQSPLWLDFLAPVACGVCGQSGRPLCAVCQSRLRADWRRVGSLWYLCEYEAARDLIDRWKYAGSSIGARELIARFGGPIGLDAAALLVPVPQSRWRFARRGYNQARQLADWLAISTGLPVADCLREPWRREQTHLAKDRRARRTERHPQIKDAASVAGRSVYLVDDICTTGRTAEVMTRVLAVAGARVVGVIVLAHARLRRDVLA